MLGVPAPKKILTFPVVQFLGLMTADTNGGMSSSSIRRVSLMSATQSSQQALNGYPVAIGSLNDLKCDHDLLRASKQRLALGQREAQGLVGQRLPLKGRHLSHDLRAVGLLNHHLYCELHAFTSSSHACSGSFRSRRLMARRSQRLTPAQ